MDEFIKEIITSGRSYSHAEKCYIVNIAGAIDCYACPTDDGAGVYAWTLKIGDVYRLYREYRYIESELADISKALPRGYKIILYCGNLNRLCAYITRNVSRETFTTRDGNILKFSFSDGIEVRDFKRIGLASLPYVAPVYKAYSWTPLTDGEREDLRAVADTITEDISKRIETDGGAGRIPLTITGYTRRALARAGVRSFQNIESEEEYILLKKAYAGGVCVANPLYIGEEIHGVYSYDIDSSYIAALLSNKFPTGSARVYRNTSVDLNNISGVWVAHIYLKNVRLRESGVVGCISKVRAELSSNFTEESGYITSADLLGITVVSPIWSIIEGIYDFDEIAVPLIYVYTADYIPNNMAEAIIELYTEKEELKGDTERKYEYRQKKAVVSSVYGLCGVDPLTYGSIEEYNKRRRAVPYQYAPFITAYAERNLYNGIMAAGASFIYSDTDSIKTTESMDIFVRWYNKGISEKIRTVLDSLGIEYDRNALYHLGTWELDYNYKRFKTLGQKKYMYEDSAGIHGVISGMKKDFSRRITFPEFREGAIISAKDSGVIRIKKSDNAYSTIAKDRDGVPGLIWSDGVYIETPVAYTLGKDNNIIEEIAGRAGEYVYTEN